MVLGNIYRTKCMAIRETSHTNRMCKTLHKASSYIHWEATMWNIYLQNCRHIYITQLLGLFTRQLYWWKKYCRVNRAICLFNSVVFSTNRLISLHVQDNVFRRCSLLLSSRTTTPTGSELADESKVAAEAGVCYGGPKVIFRLF